MASPCNDRWEDKEGDEQSRFCLHCQKHVYNLSAMTESAALSLIEQKEGKLCARFYRRADGTLLTSNCPVGHQRILTHLKVVLCSLAALITVAWISRVARTKSVPPSGRINKEPVGNTTTTADAYGCGLRPVSGNEQQ